MGSAAMKGCRCRRARARLRQLQRSIRAQCFPLVHLNNSALLAAAMVAQSHGAKVVWRGRALAAANLLTDEESAIKDLVTEKGLDEHFSFLPFTADTGAPLAERLVRALEGGTAAGGELGATRSAVVLVALDPGMRLVALRVDDDPAPIAALRRLWDAYRPWSDDLRMRALDPDRARGVPEPAPPDRVEGLDR